MNDCLFCQIAQGTIPADKVHEDDSTVAFRDITPQAPCHILVIPRRHIRSVATITPDDYPLWCHMLEVTQRLAVYEDLVGDDAGYRVVTNSGVASGQSVDHLHLHILGGRTMTWPPG